MPSNFQGHQLGLPAQVRILSTAMEDASGDAVVPEWLRGLTRTRRLGRSFSFVSLILNDKMEWDLKQ